MDDILAKKNRHLFLEEKDNVGNSFIANINNIADDLDNIDAVANDLEKIDMVADNIDNVNIVAENIDDINTTVENLDKIDQFNDNLVGLLESLLEQLGEDGNVWLVRLTELGESILATTSAFNYAVTTTLTQDIASGATLTIPEAMRYHVGTHMLMVSWNGTVCYIGDQYNEVGNFGEWSTTITMNVPLKTGDKIQFRVVALADSTAFAGQIDSVIGNTSVVATGSTENRTLANRFGDIINVKDFGAIGDGTTDDADAFCAAVVDHNAIYVPSGTYTLQFTSNNASSLPAVLSGVYGPGKLNVTIAEGIYSLDSTIDMSSGEISSLTLNGSISEEANATDASVSSSTFSVVHWDGVTKDLNYSLVTFTLDSVPEDTAVGMYAAVYDAAGDVRFNGCWEITAVSDSTITVLVMSNSAPANFESAKVKIIKTVLKFLDLEANPTGIVGIRLGNASEVALDNVVFVGAGRPVASEDGRGPIRYDSPGGAGPNDTSGVTGIDAENCGAFELGSFFAISGFSGTNISIGYSGGVFNGFSCGAGRNGIGVAFTAGTQCTGSTCSGNLIDGYVIQDNSSVLAKNASSIGNYRHGFIAIMGSEINSSNCAAYYNGGDGLYATGCAVSFINGTSLLNSQYGIHAVNGAFISCRDIACRENTLGGVYAITCSSIFISTTNNSDIDCSSNDNFDFKNDTNGFIYCPKKKSAAVADLVANIYTQGGSIAARFNSNNKLLLGISTEFSGTGPSGARLMCSGSAAFKGGLFPSEDNTYNIGNASFRFATVFAGTGTINTSDQREKTGIEAPSEALMRAWGKVGFKVFQFIDSVNAKGVNARIHVGVVAQEVQEVFASEGLDVSRYGLFCYDEWDAETNTDGNEISSAGNRYGIRYEEALSLECAYQRWLGEQRNTKIEALMQRISALENN